MAGDIRSYSLIPMPTEPSMLFGEYDAKTRELRVQTWVACPLCGRVEATSACLRLSGGAYRQARAYPGVPLRSRGGPVSFVDGLFLGFVVGFFFGVFAARGTLRIGK